MLIDSTYFRGMLSIGLSPDTGEPSVTQEAERERIEWFIQVYEKEYLKGLLGGEVCAQFELYLDGEYDSVDFDKLEKRLKGKYSPVACYVYYKFVSTGNVHVTNMGSVRSAGDDIIPPRSLLVRVWNDMVHMNKAIADEFSLEPVCDLVTPINVFDV